MTENQLFIWINIGKYEKRTLFDKRTKENKHFRGKFSSENMMKKPVVKTLISYLYSKKIMEW